MVTTYRKAVTNERTRRRTSDATSFNNAVAQGAIPVFNARARPHSIIRPAATEAATPSPLFTPAASPAPVQPQTAAYGIHTKAANTRLPLAQTMPTCMPMDVTVEKVQIHEPLTPPASPTVEPRSLAQQYIHHARHWQPDDVLVVKCQGTVFTVRRSQIDMSQLLVYLSNEPTCTSTYEGRLLVDITAHYEDAEGFALVLDVLKCGDRPFDFGSLDQPLLLRLLCASHALGLEAVMNASIDALSKMCSYHPLKISRTPTRMPTDIAIATLEMALRCNLHIMRSIFHRALYEIASANMSTYHENKGYLTKVLRAYGVRDRFLAGLDILREHCIMRWLEYMDAPRSEYPAICPHVAGVSEVTDAQKFDKQKRWQKAKKKIELGFEDEARDWSNDPLRAMRTICNSKPCRPLGWRECPGDQCKAIIYDFWERRIEREGRDFELRIRELLPYPLETRPDV